MTMIRFPFKPLLAAALASLTFQSTAQIYIMVAPNPIARDVGLAKPAQPPAQPVALALASFVPTPGAEGTPYQLDLRGLTQLSGHAAARCTSGS